MYLDQADSPKQVRAALAEGDPEMEEDVRRGLRNAVDLAWQDPVSEWDNLSKDEMLASVEHYLDGDLMGLVDELESRGEQEVAEVLRTVPEEKIREALRLELGIAADRLERWSQGRSPIPPGSSSALFEFGGGQGPGLQVAPIHQSITVRLDEPLSWVPPDTVTEILKREGPYGSEWEVVDEGFYDSGWHEAGDYLRLEIKRDNALEWAQDLRQEYYSALVDAEPAEAVSALAKELDIHYPELAKRVRKAKLPKDVLADYAVTYFQDPEEGIELLSEAMGTFGYEGSKAPTILEIDQDTLRRLGVHHGRWEHGAPWRLVDLPPEELAYEGTLQRHCVGRHGMGYKEAVERGKTAIWSLRSKFDRPLLTFEVDLRAWESARNRETPRPARGAAIVQLKGKLNRPPGKDEDEEVVLEWIFDQLGVDPSSVRDYARARAANPTPSFCAPWRPYDQRDVPEPTRQNPRFAALKQRLANPWEYASQIRRISDLSRSQQANLYAAMEDLQKARRQALEAERHRMVGERTRWRERAVHAERHLQRLEQAYGLVPG